MNSITSKLKIGALALSLLAISEVKSITPAAASATIALPISHLFAFGATAALLYRGLEYLYQADTLQMKSAVNHAVDHIKKTFVVCAGAASAAGITCGLLWACMNCLPYLAQAATKAAPTAS